MKITAKTGNFHGYAIHEFELYGCKCYVAEPEEPKSGRVWCWKEEYFEAFPDFELEMLHRGFYFCFMQIEYEFGSPRSLAHWDKFYRFLTGEFGFNRPLLFGLSVGGLYIYNWQQATAVKWPVFSETTLFAISKADRQAWAAAKKS